MEVEDYEKLLKQVYRTAPIGLCLFDTELRYRHINEWLASINGLSVEAHLDRTISEVIPDVSAEVESLLRRVMETGEPVLDGVVEAETPGSLHQKRIFQHSYHAIMSDEGIVVGVSCIVQDITERKRAEDALVEARNQFEERVQARTAELRQNRDDMRVLARRLISAHEDERRRIARELHDDLSQRLASVAIDSSMLASEIRPVTESGADKLAKLSDRMRRISTDVHQVSRQLHPSILEELGLVKAMQAECDTVQRRSAIALRFDGPSEYSSVAKSTELALYRIMQECLRNIEKHSRAVSARVGLNVSETEISLIITDTGTGFDPTQQREEPGLGMASLKERVGLLGGTISIQSEIGRGTTVAAYLPAKTRKS